MIFLAPLRHLFRSRSPPAAVASAHHAASQKTEVENTVVGIALLNRELPCPTGEGEWQPGGEQEDKRQKEDPSPNKVI